ncbi:MAG: SAM-dependent methyltransferase, partial [Acidimicrobiia bacterium]
MKREGASRQATVVVVGLGPAGVDLLVPLARQAIERVNRRYVRTGRHPAVQALESEGLAFTTFDDVYDRLDSLEAVYREMASVLARVAVEEGEVLYAVPGAPVLAERTVALLREAADVRIEVVPGLSFAEYAWNRLGIDPLSGAGARVVDGRKLEEELPLDGGTFLIAQCDGRLRLSDLKVSLLERVPPEAPVTVLHHLG